MNERKLRTLLSLNYDVYVCTDFCFKFRLQSVNLKTFFLEFESKPVASKAWTALKSLHM